MVTQGEVINVGGIEAPVLVISKNVYNESGAAIVCPIMNKKPKDILNVHIETSVISGYVICDEFKRINWKERGAFSKGTVSPIKLFCVLDIVSALFDFV